MKYILKTSLFIVLAIGFCSISHAEEDASAVLSAADLSAQGAAALEAKDAKTAVKLYQQAVISDPNNAQLQTDYANALTKRINEVNFMAKGMIAGKMLKAYQRSVEIDPNHVIGWIGLSRYYINAPAIAGGSADKAEPYAQKVFDIHPPQGNVELALIAEKRGNNAKAAEYFRATLAVQPAHGEAVAGLKRVTAEN